MDDQGDRQTDRAALSQQVVDDCLRRRAAGEDLPDEAVLAAHPDLLPELADALRALAVVGAAVARAQAGLTQRTGETVTLSRSGPGGSPAAEAVIPREIGPVRLMREIGRGGMGAVWLGRHQVLARDVAVKFLLQAVPDSGAPGFQDLLAEARAAGSVRHAGLIAVHDAAVVSGVPYLVMDYVDGVALADVLREVGPLSSAAALALLDAVGEAVAALHDAGLVHRDLKPRNILLDRAGRPYVGDFGLACACAPARRAQLATAGGTPPYMAPEVFTGEASPRSDVYALGVMLYEMLTGEQPFRGETLEQIRARHVEQPLPREPLLQRQVGPTLIEVLERATHKNPLYRTKTARHFGQALHAAVPDKEVWSRGAGQWRQLVERCDRGAGERKSPEPSTPTPKTYAELLASKAAWKRASKVASADTPAVAPVGAGGVPAVEVEGHTGPRPSGSEGLADDVLCMHCGYNLGGLREEGQCPECGTPVARSLNADRLAAADPSWLESVCRGQAYMAVGGALFLLYFCVIEAVNANFRSLPAYVWDHGFVFLNLMRLLLVPVLIGVIRTTTLDPRFSLKRQPLGSGRLSRGAAVAALLWIPASVGHWYLFSFVPPVFEPAFEGLFPVISVVLVTLYLARLAQRIPDLQLARRTRRTARGFTVCILGAAVADFLFPYGLTGAPWPEWHWLLFTLGVFLRVALLWYAFSLVRLWSAYRKVLKCCLLESRRHAAGAPLADAVAAEHGAASDTAELAADPLCVACGHNLRGLRQEGQCPECGTQVARSLNAYRLAGADPSWLERICRGQAYIAVAAGLVLALAVVRVLLEAHRQLTSSTAPGGYAWSPLDVGYSLTSALLLILVFIGVIKVTTLDPRLSLTQQPLGLRRLSRGAAVAVLLCIPIRVGEKLLPSGVPPVVQVVFDWAYPAALAFTVVVVTLHLARLAERIPDQKLARRTRDTTRRWALCVLGCWVGSVALGVASGAGPLVSAARWPEWIAHLALIVGMPLAFGFAVGAVGYTVSLVRLWFAYRKVLKRCLLESRRLAAT